MMRKLSALVLVFASLASPAATAAVSKIDISSPADGAKLDVMEQNKLEYNVTLGDGADHIHVYVDGTEAALLRQMQDLSLIHISEPTRRTPISYAVFCLKK